MMHFTGMIEFPHGVTVDGYSDRKTKLGAIRDFGRWVKKHVDAGEGDCLIENGEECLVPVDSAYDVETGKWCDGIYFFEMEEVPCASCLNDDTGEIEYAEGNWYMVAHFVK